jgi:hypothetical protein
MVMVEEESRTALMAALTTEHFALQTAANATVTEAASRSSLYVFSLSSFLVAMGFASRSREFFVPFAAIVLPGLVLLGVFTVVRLVDTAIANMRFLAAIARIRSYYRTLAPEAAAYFAPHHVRLPDSSRLGAFVPFLTTSASMIAFVNSMVAGAGIALLARDRLGGEPAIAFWVGVAFAAILMATFLAYQRWQFRVFELEGSRDGRAEAKGG